MGVPFKHTADWGGCPTLKKQGEVAAVANEYKVTKKTAADMLNKNEVPRPTPIPAPRKNIQHTQNEQRPKPIPAPRTSLFKNPKTNNEKKDASELIALILAVCEAYKTANESPSFDEADIDPTLNNNRVHILVSSAINIAEKFFATNLNHSIIEEALSSLLIAEG